MSEEEVKTEIENNPQKYGAGAFVLIYQNENDDKVREFSVDFSLLNEQAEKESFSKETYKGILYGFESAIRVVLGNYNIIPREIPIDVMKEADKLYKKIEESLNEEEKRQEAEESGLNVSK